MPKPTKILFAFFLITTGGVHANEVKTVNFTQSSPLLDGRCEAQEWQYAIKSNLAANTGVYLMHNDESIFVCATGKAEDYTVLDIYIEDPKTGLLHNLHASAQLSEKVMKGNEWESVGQWELHQWSGFWVPYAGQEGDENRKRPIFLKGKDREIRILKEKFSGNSWNMMFGLGGVKQDGEFGPTILYPEGGVSTDSSTWMTFSFVGAANMQE
ncbi:hypothetical protein DRW07_13400 [Alteromonas sediminis]|uniref:Carbohydrate-binding domain-containing protein n=1 Tax=Alteromonas sediminis TaxID=2259342 RepID=A0A3N5Z5X9_9ALTE|nr:hypothetical protein [Alteromonas sediminis]RPJ65804.1 hypothetical protein DRW07_13400 [Alteromonas sediminis]